MGLSWLVGGAYGWKLVRSGMGLWASALEVVMSVTIKFNVRVVAGFAAGVVIALIAVAMLQSLRADAAGSDESAFVPITPCRLFDLRPAPDTVGDRTSPLGPSESYPVQVTGDHGNCVGIPVEATGVSMNVTVVSPTAASFLSVVPGDVLGNPGVSSLNSVPGAPPTPNKVDVALGDGGKIRLFNLSGNVYVLADVVGYYTTATLADHSARLAAVEAENTALKADVAALKALTGSVSLQTVDGQPTVRFTGVNVQIVNGSGGTTTGLNGRGNLIIGYNENDTDQRDGSHNLIVGPYHTYTRYADVIGGYDNTATASYTLLAGQNNTTSGTYTSVTGGINNTASGDHSSVSGGSSNTASGVGSAVSGGSSNTASGVVSAVIGGQGNTASGDYSSVSGGIGNTASGVDSSVSGGANRSATGLGDWRAGSLFENS
jgi:hypothetical protein